MQTLERTVVRRHAAVVQALNGLHALLRHILLRENNRDLFRAVVAIVEEDHHIAFGDTSVAGRIHQRLHELIGIFMLLRMAVIATLHGLYHIGFLAAFAVDELVIGYLDTLPAFVTVHGIETTDN